LIPKDTIDKIFDAARIEEVVGDFITLKKRGSNLLGLCPFHNEKTPSFTVTPAKGIYKCFGCGKAGNSVNFIMEHEKLKYTDALKFLGKKYNIEVREKELTAEEKAAQDERESLFIINSYAQKFFSNYMLSTDEGKSVGLGYLHERQFTDEIVEKFQLGFSPIERSGFTKAAMLAGHKPEYLLKLGLSALAERFREEYPNPTNIRQIKQEHIGSLFDRFSGRVMFPIHNVSGRVIGFGGRILTNDKKTAKYLNSPQSFTNAGENEQSFYDKSKELYGLYFARVAITKEDFCFLVEGYTDVISMHQAGIENVVSSSGTSLTVEQIGLIHRFTDNITILYDGDAAGIKASFRGIDMLLEQGMNVRVLLFPDGDDPDSYSKKVSNEELKLFIKNNSTDFIRFKSDLLYGDAKSDPTKRMGVYREIIQSISCIPGEAKRRNYVGESAGILNVEPEMLFSLLGQLKGEMNLVEQKDRRREQEKEYEEQRKNNPKDLTIESVSKLLDSDLNPFVGQEKNLVRLLLHYGTHLIDVTHIDENNETINSEVSVAEFILNELEQDELSFVDSTYELFLYEFKMQMHKQVIPNADYFVKHRNPQLAQITINLISSKYELSNWTSRHNISVPHEMDIIKKTINHDLFIYKEKRLQKLLRDEKEKLRTAASDEEIHTILISIQKLDALKSRVNKLLGRTII
jgi:DNA primase